MLEGNVGPIEERLIRELTELSAESAPRRFAICLLDVAHEDGVVLGWGLAVDDQAVAYVPADGHGPSGLLCSSSLARLPRLVRRDGDVRLIWIDAETAETAETAEAVETAETNG
jgi:hypothetical protein